MKFIKKLFSIRQKAPKQNRKEYIDFVMGVKGRVVTDVIIDGDYITIGFGDYAHIKTII